MKKSLLFMGLAAIAFASCSLAVNDDGGSSYTAQNRASANASTSSDNQGIDISYDDENVYIRIDEENSVENFNLLINTDSNTTGYTGGNWTNCGADYLAFYWGTGASLYQFSADAGSNWDSKDVVNDAKLECEYTNKKMIIKIAFASLGITSDFDNAIYNLSFAYTSNNKTIPANASEKKASPFLSIAKKKDNLKGIIIPAYIDVNDDNWAKLINGAETFANIAKENNNDRDYIVVVNSSINGPFTPAADTKLKYDSLVLNREEAKWEKACAKFKEIKNKDGKIYAYIHSCKESYASERKVQVNQSFDNGIEISGDDEFIKINFDESVDSTFYIYINADGNTETGLKHWAWAESGADFLVYKAIGSNPLLYTYSTNGVQSEKPKTLTKEFSCKYENNKVALKISFKDLGLTSVADADKLSFGYMRTIPNTWDIEASSIKPAQNTSFASVKTKEYYYYGYRNLDDVKADIETWITKCQEYGVTLDGIWIDEFYPRYEIATESPANGDWRDVYPFPNDILNAPDQVKYNNGLLSKEKWGNVQIDPKGGYYDNLCQFIHGKGLGIIGNAGGDLVNNQLKYEELVDILVRFEKSYAVAEHGEDGKSANWAGLRMRYDYPREADHLALIHGAELQPEALEKVIDAAVDNNFGYVYVIQKPYQDYNNEGKLKNTNLWGSKAAGYPSTNGHGMDSIPDYFTKELEYIAGK